MSNFVLDCSVTMAWLLPKEESNYANSVQDELENNTAFIPTIWHYEVANVLVMTERRKQITFQQINACKILLSNSPIETDEISTEQSKYMTLQLARDFKLTIYDAAYLELACRKSLPIATLDKAMRKASEKLGIEIFHSENVL